MQTVTVKGSEYHIGTVNALTQLHLARRMAPVTASLKALADQYDEADPLALLESLGKALASLPDEDVDYIIHTCLEAVSARQPGGGFAPLRRKGANLIEVDLMTMLSLTVHVVRENLGSFFSDLNSLSLQREAQTETAKV